MPFRELTLPSQTREELQRTTQGKICKLPSQDYLPILLCTLDRDGNADINRSEVKRVPGTNCSR